MITQWPVGAGEMGITLGLAIALLLMACGGDHDAGSSTSTGGAPSTGQGVTSATGIDTTEPSTGTTGTTALDTTAPTTTGDPLPTDGCHNDAECAPNQCMAPADPACDECVPFFPTCVSDFECEVGDVCIEVPVACSCDSPYTTICSPACISPKDCSDGQACNDTGHCYSGDPCIDDQGCPPLFRCTSIPGLDVCRRRLCTNDGECPGGLCIDHLCHDAPGMCVPAAF